MARTNGKTDVQPDNLDLEHELPAAEDDGEESGRVAAAREVPQPAAELENLKNERDTLLDRMARMQADFDNARKRASREQQDFKEFALADAIRTLLPILDSFDRALVAKPQNPEDFRSGVKLIRKQLRDALERLEVRAVPAKGQPFDPRFHEAIEMVDSPEAADNHVLDELQPGYKLKDRLLRPAMVRVARNPKK